MVRIIAVAMLLALASCVRPHVTIQTDGSAASVQTACNNANNGDTVTMPAGNFNWITRVTITKQITLIGAGKTATIITDNTPKPGDIISVQTTAGLLTRLSGFRVNGAAAEPQGSNAGVIHVNGNSHTFRMDNVTMYHCSSGLFFTGYVWGVVDHCEFYSETGPNGGYIPVTVGHGFWPSPDGLGSSVYGDGSWHDSTHLGSGEGITFEDDYNLSNGAGGMGFGDCGTGDGSGGCRYTIRHCVFENQNWGCHGTETRTRGMRQFEIYQNEFKYTIAPPNQMDKGATIRSGTGVVWGNWWHATSTGIAGYNKALVFQCYRDFSYGGPPWQSAPSTWDAPDPRLDQCGWGATQDAVDRYVLAGTCNPGTPCEPLNHRTGGPDWPRNQAEPVYVWGNTWNPVPNNPGVFISGDYPETKTIYVAGGPNTPPAGRSLDIIDNGNCIDGTYPCNKGTAKPGYSPAPYPHPLVSGGGQSSPSPTGTISQTPTVTPGSTATVTATPTVSASVSPTPSPNLSPTATASGLPIAPSSMIATAKNATTISLGWQPNDPNADAIYVYRSTDNTNFAYVTSMKSTSTGMDDPGLTSGRTYYYYVKSKNAAGYSTPSNTASATTSGGVTSPTPTVTPSATATSTPTVTATPTQTPALPTVKITIETSQPTNIIVATPTP